MIRSIRTKRSASASSGRLPTASLVLLAVFTLLGCDAGDTDDAPGIPVEPPEALESAGLFEVPGLVEILELQNLRDGEALVERLAHDDAEVRARAAFALASVRDPEAFDPLVNLLADPSVEVRRDAAFALGHIELPDEGRALLDALEGEGAAVVRRRILGALGGRAGEAVAGELAGWDPGEEEAREYWLALSRIGLREVGLEGAGVVERLVEGLRSEDPAVRERAAYFFGRMSDPEAWEVHVEQVREALDRLDSDERTAMHLLPALGRLRDRSDAPRFLEWMAESDDWRIRANAVQSVGTSALLETAGVRDALWERVESDPSTHVAVLAANALLAGFRVPDQVTSRARAWLEVDPEAWRTHLPFVEHFGMMGDPEIVNAWVDFHQPRFPEIAHRAPELLAANPTPDAGQRIFDLARGDDPLAERAVMSFLSTRWEVWVWEPDAIAVFYDLFEEKVLEGDPRPARHAAIALGDLLFQPFGSRVLLEEAYRGRVERLTEEEVPVLRAILASLATIGDPDAVPLIEEQLGHEDFRIRKAAAAAYEELTGQEVRGLEIPDPEIPLDVEYLRELGPAPLLVLETTRGTIRIRLAPEQAPVTVQTIARYAEEGLYDDVHFHRVVSNFVIQTGDFAAGDGTGGPGQALRTEVTQIPFQRGVVGMASSGWDTEGSQFFITHSAQPHLDGSFGQSGDWMAYTAFGWLEEGESALDRIQEGDRVERAWIERSP
jgi:cyclophilin family peptidyl-prolyl cis-trans isomerase/HEAT repeat protein